MDLRWLQTFVAVADHGSLIGAARELGVSAPAVTRAVAKLEAELGVSLLLRTTRSLKLTGPGERFLVEARAILAALDAAVVDAASEQQRPRGHLTITASVAFGRTHVTELVNAFVREHPDIRVTLLLLDRVTHLIDEGIDVALRIGELPDSSLVARKLGAVRRLLVASPDYLAARGTLRRPSELGEHDVVAFTGLMPDRRWRYQQGGKARELQLSPRLELNDAHAAVAAAEQGLGITAALSTMVAPAVAAGRLVTVLERYTSPPVPVHLLTPQVQVLAAKVRAFLDFAAPRLRAQLRVRGEPE